MEVEPGDIAVGVMMTVFGFAGLFLAAGAQDDAMYVFGLSLVGFALAFGLGLIRRHYDRVPATAELEHRAAPILTGLALAGSEPTGAAALAPVAATPREKAAIHV